MLEGTYNGALQPPKFPYAYKILVRKYLKILKSCVATKEDPGLLYEAMFPPDQDVDLGLFDIEENRIKELRRKGVWG